MPVQCEKKRNRANDDKAHNKCRAPRQPFVIDPGSVLPVHHQPLRLPMNELACAIIKHRLATKQEFLDLLSQPSTISFDHRCGD
jgi:hypothetical protein